MRSLRQFGVLVLLLVSCLAPAMACMAFVEAIATTKVINVVFLGHRHRRIMGHDLIDYRLGMILGATMFVGAVVGVRFAICIGTLSGCGVSS